MKEVISKLVKHLIEENRAAHKVPDAVNECEVVMRLSRYAVLALEQLEAEGILKSYPNVNGIKMYSVA